MCHISALALGDLRGRLKKKKKQGENYVLLVRFTICVLILESTYRHQATIDDEVVSMEILDTAGQVRGCVCCYPVPWLGYAAGEGSVVVAAVRWGQLCSALGTQICFWAEPPLLPHAGSTPFCKGSCLELSNSGRTNESRGLLW